MLDAREIRKEIARLEYEESSYPNYAKLADLYIIRAEMLKEQQTAAPAQIYSTAPVSELAHSSAPVVSSDSSDFIKNSAGKPVEQVLDILDELMDSLKVTQPRVYDAAMKRLERLRA